MLQFKDNSWTCALSEYKCISIVVTKIVRLNSSHTSSSPGRLLHRHRCRASSHTCLFHSIQFIQFKLCEHVSSHLILITHVALPILQHCSLRERGDKQLFPRLHYDYPALSRVNNILIYFFCLSRYFFSPFIAIFLLLTMRFFLPVPMCEHVGPQAFLAKGAQLFYETNWI